MDLQEVSGYGLDSGIGDLRYLPPLMASPVSSSLSTQTSPTPEAPKLANEHATPEERIAALEKVVAHLTEKLQTCQKDLETVRTGYRNFGLDGNFRAFVQQVKKAYAQIQRHH